MELDVGDAQKARVEGAHAVKGPGPHQDGAAAQEPAGLEQVLHPFVAGALIGEEAPLALGHRHRVARLVDEPGQGEHGAHLRAFAQHRQLARQLVGVVTVIAVEDGKELPAHVADARVQRHAAARILWQAVIVKPRVGDARADFLRVVRRAVLHQDDLQVAHGLGQHAVHRLAHEPPVAERRHDHADQGGAHVGTMLRDGGGSFPLLSGRFVEKGSFRCLPLPLAGEGPAEPGVRVFKHRRFFAFA